MSIYTIRWYFLVIVNLVIIIGMLMYNKTLKNLRIKRFYLKNKIIIVNNAFNVILGDK
jgi:hypothetical protein